MESILLEVGRYGERLLKTVVLPTEFAGGPGVLCYFSSLFYAANRRLTEIPIMRLRLSRALLALVFVCVLPAWKALERAPALPPVYANEATIDGMTGIRYATYQPSGIDALFADLENSLQAQTKDY